VTLMLTLTLTPRTLLALDKPPRLVGPCHKAKCCCHWFLNVEM
jgi:hypothetical protein